MHARSPEASSPVPTPVPASRRAPKGLAPILLLAGAAVVLARTVSGAELARALTIVRAAGPALAWVVVPPTLLLVQEAWGWQRLYALLGVRVPLRATFLVRVVAEAVALTVPAGPLAAEATKTAMMHRWERVPTSTTTATLAGWKLSVVATHAAFLALATALGLATIRAASVSLLRAQGLPWIVVSAAIVLAAVAVATYLAAARGAWAVRLLDQLVRLPIPALRRALERRRSAFLRTDVEARALWSRPPRALAAVALPFLAGWWLEAVDVMVLLAVVGTRLSWTQAVVFVALLSLVRTLAFVVPGGLGVSDAGAFAVLQALGVPDAPTVAAAYVVLRRSRDVAWIALGYALLLTVRPRLAPTTV